MRKLVHPHTTHGKSRTPMYKRYYRVRGDGWDNFREFENWSHENGYEEGFELHRLDPTGEFTPDNCHWIPRPVSTNIYEYNRRRLECLEKKV